MGVDLYVMAEDEEHADDISTCSGDLANELDVLSGLGKGTIMDFFSSLDEPVYHDPKKVLVAVEKTLTKLAKKNEDAFERSKKVCLEDLQEIKEVLQKAIEVKTKVSVTIG